MQRATADLIGIKALSRDEIMSQFAEVGLPAFRAKQVIQWLYQKGAHSYDEMTNLPLALRQQLSESLPLHFPEIVRKQVSQDGTRKYLLRLGDGALVESVAMPTKTRLSACVSTQAGCPMRCQFCATGRNGYTRSLGCGEIVDQATVIAQDFGQRVTNVVLMGQGEPFLNYDASIEAMRIFNSKDGLGIGARHITVSTCGILPQIRRFAQEPEQFTLAVSLHSAVQETRDRIMPGVRSYPLERLHDSIASYADATGRRPTYEYALMAGINDSDAELKALIAFTRRTLCHVNLIQLNEVKGSSYHPSTDGRLNAFKIGLERAGVEVTVRESRGSDIDAACGQLKQKASRK
jgi:23S rRNA (adenine2503-C2)-methyltransferase